MDLSQVVVDLINMGLRVNKACRDIKFTQNSIYKINGVLVVEEMRFLHFFESEIDRSLNAIATIHAVYH